MTEDPTSSLRDQLLRRPLTPAETTRVEDWLREHPAEASTWWADARIAESIRQLKPASVPTNFTNLVLAEIRRGTRRTEAPLRFRLEFHWRAVLARHAWLVGTTALVVLASGLAWRTNVTRRDAEFARQVVPLRVIGELSPSVLQDFDAIRRFAERPAPVDFELLAALQP